MTFWQSQARWIRTVMRDVGRGFFIVTHSGLATVGLLVAVMVLALSLRPDWLARAETELVQWLRERQVLLAWLPEHTARRVTALDPQVLSPAQARVADWLSRKYRVAPEPMAALVAEAHAQADPAREQGTGQASGAPAASAPQPDGGGHAAGDPVPPVRKEV